MNRKHALIVLSAALAARLIYAFLAPASVSYDSAEYLKIAGNLLSAGSYSMDGAVPAIQRAPGYPFFIALTGLFSGGIKLPFLLACQALLDSVSAVYVLALGAAFLPPAWALGAGLFYALHPVFIGFSGMALSETLFMHFWLAFMNLSLRGQKDGGTARWAAAGALLALAALTRPAHMFYLLPAALLLALSAPGVKAAAARLAAFAGAFLLCLAPWTVRNYKVTGAFLPVCTGGALALWIGSVPGTAYPDELLRTRTMEYLKTLEGEAELSAIAKENWRRQGPAIVADLPRRLVKFWVTSHSSVFLMEKPNRAYAAEGRYGALAFKAALLLLQAATLALALAGLLALRRRPLDAAFLLMPALFASAHILSDWGPSRYHISALPPLGVLALYALSRRGGKKEPAR